MSNRMDRTFAVLVRRLLAITALRLSHYSELKPAQVLLLILIDRLMHIPCKCN